MTRAGSNALLSRSFGAVVTISTFMFAIVSQDDPDEAATGWSRDERTALAESGPIQSTIRAAIVHKLRDRGGVTRLLADCSVSNPQTLPRTATSKA